VLDGYRIDLHPSTGGDYELAGTISQPDTEWLSG